MHRRWRTLQWFPLGCAVQKYQIQPEATIQPTSLSGLASLFNRFCRWRITYSRQYVSLLQKKRSKNSLNTREHRGILNDLADEWSPFDVKKGYLAIKLR